MKGLAMQASVKPDLPIEAFLEELRILITGWIPDSRPFLDTV